MVFTWIAEGAMSLFSKINEKKKQKNISHEQSLCKISEIGVVLIV